ncbi:Hsp20/alpha crystallin family protein [Natronomonas gomsonensis]|uniref:Hsp20/alpha crystallin family protein n=1 Tax=Natronomonas gomsonensis TaxID=1046043 RepID=UPI0020CA3BCE|nr:Hsp20/alpha crystallin family protein [Natronomonas gomsonensis]MCY4729683.1 Hsp20/alpha crystallin family protein [Natronomonas gomsonensis]
MARNPFDEIERMFDRMSHQFETLDDDLFEGSVAVDIEDTGDAFVVTADLPGFDGDDIDVELSGETLTLSAAHSESTETEDEDDHRYIRRERREQSVNRSIRLPAPVEEADTEASYNNGVLTVTLSKVGAGEGHDIPIN